MTAETVVTIRCKQSTTVLSDSNSFMTDHLQQLYDGVPKSWKKSQQLGEIYEKSTIFGYKKPIITKRTESWD